MNNQFKPKIYFSQDSVLCFFIFPYFIGGVSVEGKIYSHFFFNRSLKIVHHTHTLTVYCACSLVWLTLFCLTFCSVNTEHTEHLPWVRLDPPSVVSVCLYHTCPLSVLSYVSSSSIHRLLTLILQPPLINSSVCVDNTVFLHVSALFWVTVVLCAII